MVTLKLGKVSELIGVIMVEIKFQFLLLSVITFIFSVTISLEKIICRAELLEAWLVLTIG